MAENLNLMVVQYSAKIFFVHKWFLRPKKYFLCKKHFFRAKMIFSAKNYFWCKKYFFLCKNDFLAKKYFLCKKDFYEHFWAKMEVKIRHRGHRKKWFWNSDTPYSNNLIVLHSWHFWLYGFSIQCNLTLNKNIERYHW